MIQHNGAAFSGLFRRQKAGILHRLGKVVIALHRGIVFQNTQNKPLLDSLSHGVAMERVVFDRSFRAAGLVLGCSGEGEVAGIDHHLPAFHDLVDSILNRLLFLIIIAIWSGFFQDAVHRSSGFPALTGVRLVNDGCSGVAESR